MLAGKDLGEMVFDLAEAQGEEQEHAIECSSVLLEESERLAV